MTPPKLDIEDEAALRFYLAKRSGGGASVVSVGVLAGGVSNKTVHVGLADGTGWVLKQSLAKLRVEKDWFSDPARIFREAAALRAFHRLAPACVPALIFEDRAQQLLAMAAVPTPHENLKEQLMAGDSIAGCGLAMGELLGRLHGDAAAQRDTLAPAFDDRAFFESLRIEPYFCHCVEHVPDAAAFLEALIADLRRHRHTLVHGDYSPKNMLTHYGQIHLIDFEVTHWGDPAFDVGFALTHLLSKAHHLTEKRTAFLAEASAFWNAYQQALGGWAWRDGLEQRVVRATLGVMLARCRGCSPLEYLTASQRDAQAGGVLAMMEAPPATVARLVEIWTHGLEQSG